MRLLPLDNNPTLVPLSPQEPIRQPTRGQEDTLTDATELARLTSPNENKRVNPYNLMINLSSIKNEKYKVTI